MHEHTLENWQHTHNFSVNNEKYDRKDSDNRISDIHIWKVSGNHYAAIISLVTHFPKPIEHYKELLSDFHKLSHTTIEVYECKDTPSTSP